MKARHDWRELGQQRGLTLIEMLFLVAIVTVIISLLLPVLVYHREKSRSAECQANLKEIVLAANQYCEYNQYYPAGFCWSIINGRRAVEGSLGSGHGPLVAILPYMEQVALFHRINFNQNIHSRPNQTVFGVKIRQYQCPSDQAIAELASLPDASYIGNSNEPGGFHQMARSSYAGVAGPWVVNTWKLAGMGQSERSSFMEARASQLGMFNVHSELTRRDVADGASNTFLFGEHAMAVLPMAMRRDAYWWVSGNHGDTMLTTLFPPNGHKMQINHEILKNSASSMHSGVVNFAFVDGSVRAVRDSIQSISGQARPPVPVSGGLVPHVQGWVIPVVWVELIGPDPFWDTIFKLPDSGRFGVYQALSTRAGGETASPD